MAPDRVARGVLSELPKATVSLLMFLLLQISATARAQADSKAAAREHFAKGVAAFDDRRFGEAAEEFEAAYKLSPAYVVLYNIGQVDVVLGRAVEAVDAFDKYLKQGASSISETRRQEVQQEIEKQIGRIGTIKIRTSPEAAEIRVDGGLVGKTPLGKPVRVTAGKHAVEATLAGHATQVRELEVAGRAELEIELTLEAITVPSSVVGAGVATPVSPSAPPAAIEKPTPDKVLAQASATEMSAAEKPLIIERTFIEAPLIQQPPARPQLIETGTAGTIHRVAGYVLTAGGLATATIGGLIVYDGANRSSEAGSRVITTQAEYDQAAADYNAGKSRSRKGWEIAGVGAAALVGGVILLATVPQKATLVALAPWMTADAGGVVVEGAW